MLWRKQQNNASYQNSSAMFVIMVCVKWNISGLHTFEDCFCATFRSLFRLLWYFYFQFAHTNNACTTSKDARWHSLDGNIPRKSGRNCELKIEQKLCRITPIATFVAWKLTHGMCSLVSPGQWTIWPAVKTAVGRLDRLISSQPTRRQKRRRNSESQNYQSAGTRKNDTWIIKRTKE